MWMTYASLLLVGALVGAGQGSRQELSTVSQVDLTRYVGTWYEIARYPNRFERKCDRNVQARYSLRPEGGITVENSCVKADGKQQVAKGRAKVVDAATQAKLKVTFFWPFYGDYWVIGLDPEYRWAVVGEPSRKYLWILSRTPSLPDATFEGILSLIKDKGYDTGRLVRTRQAGESPWS